MVDLGRYQSNLGSRIGTGTMKVLDAGHEYELDVLDGGPFSTPKYLRFVKREGEQYPGNVGHYSGTTIQEVLRACIDRLKYVDNQVPDLVNRLVIGLLRQAIWYLEERAHRRHGIKMTFIEKESEIESMPVNSHGHLWKEDMHDDGRTD